MGTFFKRNHEKMAESVISEEEVSVIEPQQIFKDEEVSDIEPVSLLTYLYSSEYLDEAYDAVMKNAYDNKNLIALCDNVNKALKQGAINEPDLRQQTPKTLALTILKAYSIAITDDYKGEAEDLEKAVASGKAQIQSLQQELDQAKESYDAIVEDYNAILVKQSSMETFSPSVKADLEMEISNFKAIIEDKEEIIATLEAKCQNLENTLAKTRQEMQTLNSNLDSLANTNTGDDKIEELIKEINDRDTENSKLNSIIVTLKNDLTQARRDAKIHVSNKDIINGFKATIALLTENLDKATEESIRLLGELGEAKQSLAIKEQELIAEKSLSTNYKKKAEITIKKISGEATNLESLLSSDSVVAEEIASTSVVDLIDEVPAEPASVVEEPDVIKMKRADLLILMIAGLETRSMASNFEASYRNKVQEQFIKLIDNRDSLNLPLSELKASIAKIFEDVLLK